MIEPGRHAHLFKYVVVPAKMMIQKHFTKIAFIPIFIVCTKLNFDNTSQATVKFPQFGRLAYVMLDKSITKRFTVPHQSITLSHKSQKSGLLRVPICVNAPAK